MDSFEKPLYVTKSFLPPFEEYSKLLEGIWENHLLTNEGPLHNELQQKLQEYLMVENALLYTNGHMALDIAIKALKLKGEVITTPFTFVSTTNAIAMNGLTPVFCDIRSDNFTIDTKQIENLITDKTSAIVAVHVYGCPCDVEELKRIADKYKLRLIYDAAHAFGLTVNGNGIGTYGDISMFSFHATKLYNTIEGGALTFANKELLSTLKILRNFGITGTETCEMQGLNAKMSEFQAAMGIVNLRYVNDCIARRRQVYEIYSKGFSEIAGIRCLTIPDGVAWNYAYFPIIVEDDYDMSRDELFDELAKFQVHARKYFYPLTSQLKAYQNYNPGDTPVALGLAGKVLCLPMDTYIEDKDVEKIINIIKHIPNISSSMESKGTVPPLHNIPPAG